MSGARPLGTSDDGRPDPRLVAALAAWRAAPSPAARAEVLAALVDARVFLALAARAGETEVGEHGLLQERSAEMALLSVVGTAGARALPAFPDGTDVPRWREEARPVPVRGPLACATALDDGADALLLDPGGADLVVGADELASLADGRVPVPGTSVSTRRTAAALQAPAGPPDRALLDAVAAALHGEPVEAARLLEGPSGPVLGVVPARGLAPADLAALADRVARRLGPVLPVPLRRRRWRSRR
ncbi:MAG TPA: SseB family protein [Mycobacteriales bacterium]|nr:SseB family protein [Mycobacteriales bacterium]